MDTYTKQDLIDGLNKRFPTLRKSDMQLLLTSGFAMGAGRCVYASDCGTYKVSQTALNGIMYAKTREDSLSWTKRCPITSKENLANPAGQGCFYNAAAL